MDQTPDPPAEPVPARRRQGALVAAMAAMVVVAGCVSAPRPAGPVRVEGAVPPAGEVGTAGTPTSRVPQGPLLLRGARLESTGADYAWAVELVNPSDTTFDVSLVVTLMDEDDRPVGSGVQELRLGPGDVSGLDGTIAVTAPPARFRIEYWVRLLPPPERRIGRFGG